VTFSPLQFGQERSQSRRFLKKNSTILAVEACTVSVRRFLSNPIFYAIAPLLKDVNPGLEVSNVAAWCGSAEVFGWFDRYPSIQGLDERLESSLLYDRSNLAL
jgi:hypothetical protein